MGGNSIVRPAAKAFDAVWLSQTERLLLRPYRIEDAQWYLEMFRLNRGHIERAVPGLLLETMADSEEHMRKMIAWWPEGLCIAGAFLRQTGEYVGQIALVADDKDPGLFMAGWFVDIDHVGRGFATEAARAIVSAAFTQLGARKVYAKMREDNVRSAKVAERCGMTLEGRLRALEQAETGEWLATLSYGILREEFLARQDGPA